MKEAIFRWIDRVKDAREVRRMDLATAKRRCRNRIEWRGVTDKIL